MSIPSDIDKLFIILKEIRKSVNALSLKKGEEVARKLIEFFENLDLSESIDASSVESYLEPVEKLRSYPCPLINDTSIESFLAKEGVCVGAFDGSSHDPGAHFRVSLLLINVGYWICNYSSGSIVSGNEAKVLVDIPLYRDRNLKIKEFEYSLAENLWKEQCSDERLLLYDESFNLRYTLSWDANSRRSMGEMLKRHLEKMVKMNVIPVAVFYTRSSDLYRFYEAYKGDKPYIDMAIQDKVLMNVYLSEGERSSVFKVKSSVVDPVGLDLLAFYIKTSGGVMRIEFPTSVSDKIDLIHCTVLAQSILGGGYPIALQRAHEWAVLNYNDRMVIEEEIARLLGIPYADMLYSGKRSSKRWPIV